MLKLMVCLRLSLLKGSTLQVCYTSTYAPCHLLFTWKSMSQEQRTDLAGKNTDEEIFYTENLHTLRPNGAGLTECLALSCANVAERKR